MHKILIIEDDDRLCSLVKDYLEKYGYQIYLATDFSRVEKSFEEVKPDLLLLDINLPYFDGFYLCRAIRKISNIPIIIVSARNGDMDQVLAIETGADDYIIKPFKLEILNAKIKAALRRVYGEYSLRSTEELVMHEFKLNEKTFKMEFRGNTVELSKNEFKLIKRLLENSDRITPREELFEVLWDDFNFIDDNTLTVNVTRIKSKLLELGIKDAITTKKRVGYGINKSAFEGSVNE